jgi:hypothetical protein
MSGATSRVTSLATCRGTRTRGGGEESTTSLREAELSTTSLREAE